MAGTRIFDVSIVSGTSHSLYTIYYDLVNGSNIATRVSTSNPATGVTYNDLTSVGGVRVEVPESATKILLYNDSCLVDDEIILPTPTPSPSPTPSSTPTPTPTPTPNCDFGVDTIVTTPTPTPSPTPTNTPTPSPTSTPTPTPTPNCNFDVDVVVNTPTPTPSPSPTPSPTPTPTISPTPTPSPTPSPTTSPTPTPSPTISPTPTPSPSPSPTPTPTPNCDFAVDVDYNLAPTGFTPTSLSQNENTATGTTIATFSAGDPDTGNTHTFSLVSGTGDTDNASFTLSSGGVLKNKVVFDRETKSSYSIRVRVTDQGGLWFEDTRTVNVINVNETPYGITLSNNTINENSVTGTTIGVFNGLDPDPNETFTFTLTGTGNDNSSFTITSVSQTAATLKSGQVFNYEVKNSYTIEVTVTDSGNNTYTDTFDISVLDVNETPSSISISSTSIDENVATGTTVGTLSTTDPDANNTFTYTLVSGLGGTDNTSFYIDGDLIKSNEVFDYETKNSYSIRVRSTDQGGLFVERVITISITNISVSGTVSITNPLCYAGTGTIEVTSQTGGSSPYTYSINGITYQTSTTFTKTAGSYTVYIKDSNGEIGTVSATITQPSAVTISVQDYTLPSCNGDSDGNIVVTGSGGTGSLEYSKDGTNWQTGTTFSDLSNGTYTITVRDENGCSKTTTQTLNRTVVTSTITTSNLDCNGDGSGSITIAQPSGGTGTGYEVKLGSGGTYETPTWPKTYSSLSAGTYHVYIKDSNDCEYLFTRVLTQPNVLNVVENSKTYPTCWNSTNGALSVTASGGTSPYTYSLDDVTYQISSSFTGLTQGTYTVRVKDSNDCKDTVSVDIRRSPVSATIAITGTTCNGGNNGAISVTNGAGGTGSEYKVKLDDGAYVDIPKTYTGLRSGSYTITVKDSNDCETTYSNRNVTQPAAVTATTTYSNPTCSTDSDGSITVNASGGNGSYTYSINGGDYQESNQFTGLGVGTYTISIKDGNDCTGSTTRTLSKSAVGSSISVTGVTCNGGFNGRVSAGTPFGGNGPTYQYKWNNGDWVTFNTTTTFTNLSAGTYPFVVKDGEGCETSYSVSVTQPTAVVASASVTNPTCYNGTNGQVVLSATGGTGSKLYSINGVNYFTSGTFTGLGVGTYTGYAKDSNNCIDTVSFTLSKSSPTATVTHTDIACNGDANGTITVSNPTGGNGGGTFSNYDVKLNSGSWISFSSTSYQFTGLSGGIQSIYIRDNSNCVSGAIGVYISEPSAVNAGGSGTAPTCDGGTDGSITWTRSGGVGSYTYTMNGSEITSLTQTGLGEGTYTFVVTDGNGCSDSHVITLSKSPVSVSTTQTNVTCNGGSNGSLSINSISGGNGGTYQYRWNNGSWTNFTEPVIFSSLSAGSYPLSVRDRVQCTNSYTRSITQPTAVSFTTSASFPTCWDGTNGSITVTASGGTGGYQYSKNNGTSYQTSNVFTSLSNGTYAIKVKDSSGCTTAATNVALSRTAPTASITTSSTSCYQGADGSITVSNPSGGYGGAAQSYQHKLNDGTYANFQSTSYTYTNKEAGVYTVWIKDFSGCEKSYTAIVTQPTQLTATITAYSIGSNGDITVTSGGGTWNKTYRLYRDTTSPYTVGGGTLVATITGVTSGNPSQTFSNLAEGYYYVVVTDANGCTASTDIQSTFAPTLYTYYISSFRLNTGDFCTTNYIASETVLSESSTIPGMLATIMYNSEGSPYVVASGRYAFISATSGDSSANGVGIKHLIEGSPEGDIMDVAQLDCSQDGGGANPL